MSLMRTGSGTAGGSALVATIETLPVTLDFSNQNIDDFPDPMKKLLSAYEKTNVKSLNFSGNALASATLLEWFNSLSACSGDNSRGFCELLVVDVSRNVLSDIPFVGLGNARFPKLSRILAHENNIYQINTQTAELALKESATIDLGNNNISDITLSALNVGGRDFDSLLDSLSQAASLDNVALVSLLSPTGLEGGLSGIVNGTLRLRKLKTFSLMRCNLEVNSIPSGIGLLSTLEVFSAIDFGITGSIPFEFGQLIQLINLDLQNNAITGSIPSQLGKLTKLSRLLLKNNQLTGSIPSQLGKLNQLNRLYLEINQLTGSIPSQLGLLTKMETLNLEANELLIGSIPSELGQLTEMLYLFLDRNQLNGSIPSQLGLLTQLNGLFLPGNQLTGSIPSQLGLLTQLSTLILYNNTLSFNRTLPWQVEALRPYPLSDVWT